MKADSLKRILATFLLVGQVGLAPAVAFADTNPSSSPVPTVTATPTPSPSPSASPTATPDPSPSAVSPSPSASVSPTVSPLPTAAATPSSSASPSPTIGAGVTGPTVSPGPTVPTGTIPAYAFNMSSRLWVPTDASSFAWDKVSGYWLSPLYLYDPAKGYYEIFGDDQAKPTNLLTSAGAVSTPLGVVAPGSAKYDLVKSLGLLPSDPSFGLTGPSSNNSVSELAANSATFDLTNLVKIINAVQSNATSGNATASSNSKAGDIGTGNAAVIATLVNLLSSAWSWSNGALNFFVNNMFGNHNGDINLNPTQSVNGGGGAYGQSSLNNFGVTGPNSNNSIATDTTNNLTVKQSDGSAITNNLDLNAKSGNASGANNTQVGNATSGDATVEANLINLINSYITSGDSFFGVLNLFGNLNGDILFPTGFLDSALPSGSGTQNSVGTTGPNSSNSIGSTNNNTANLTTDTSHSVANNINASAQSGNANVGNNTLSGDATTGDAKTNNALYNLDNTNIFGDNAVLVIVNVMGHWLGHIMNLPSANGTASALLTGGATTNHIGTTGPNSNNSLNATTNNNADITLNQKGSITNNINANATSGDATLTGNTKAGSAASGASKVATNTANIINSGINVKHWFGVLVVNVFGDWFGSVGDNTSAGNVVSGGKGSGSEVHAVAPSATAQAQAFANVTKAPLVTSLATSTPAVLGDTTTKKLAAIHNPILPTAKATSSNSQSYILFGFSALVMLFAGVLAFFERRMKQT